MFKKKGDTTPPIFADLLIELNGQYAIINVEEPGWMERYGDALNSADRVGLILRGEKKPRVWMKVNGGKPEYFSRVMGQIDEYGERRIRVVALHCNDVWVWLHRDGLVEVQPEPHYRG